MRINNFLKRLYFHYGYRFHTIRKLEWSYMLINLKPKNSEKILDIGCGNGAYPYYLAKGGSKVWGIDISAKEVQKAKKYNSHNNCIFTEQSAENLSFSNEFFDKVISICVLEHINDDIKALNEANRVLKKGGLLLLSVDSFSYRMITDKSRKEHAKRYNVKQFYTYKTIKSKLERCGFKIVGKKYILNHFLSYLVYNIGYLLRFKKVFLLSFPILYPFAALGELLSNKKEGYILIIKAIKK